MSDSMNDSIIMFDPATVIPAEPISSAKPAITALLWLVFLAASVGALVWNIDIRLHLLPTAPVDMVWHFLILGFFLHCMACYLAGGAIALAPRSKPLLGLTILVLAVNVVFTLALILSGPATITYIR